MLLSDFSYIQAIAASPFAVFGATPHGLIIYDRRVRAWQLPVTTLDGYPSARVRAALADAVDHAVWLGTDDGWARYDADLRRWERGLVAGGVGDFILDTRDPASGIFMRGASGWDFVPRGMSVPVPRGGRPLPPPGQRFQPLDPRTALDQAPMADALRAMILTDRRLRTYRFTSAAHTPEQNELFFGTDGMGIVRIDAITAEWQTLSFGLLAPRAGAVVMSRTPSGVWVATAGGGGWGGAGERRGLTWVAGDFSAVAPIEGPGVIGFRFLRGRRLIASESDLWLASDGGLLKIEKQGYRARLFDAGSGLPSDDALCVAPAPDGAWVGTTRGLAVVTNDAKVFRIGALSHAVLSLLAVRESLWVGSAAGLGLLVPGASVVVIPPDVADQPVLRQPVVALARVHDTIVAATADQLAWRDPASHAWTVARSRADLGAVTVLAGEEGGGGVWIGGTAGLAFWNPARSTFQVLRVPGDVPASVRDLAADASYLWVATDSGLVRFARDAVLGR